MPNQTISASELIDPEKFIALLPHAELVAVDTETNGYEIRDGRGFAMGVSAACEIKGYGFISTYLPFRHKHGPNLPKETLHKFNEIITQTPRLVFHNAKFDLVSLSTLGINIVGQFYDTMLMAHMVDENIPSKSLDYLTKSLLNDPGKKMKGSQLEFFIRTCGWGEVPASLMAEYGAYDADLTYRLYSRLLPDFVGQGFDGELWDIEQEFIRLLIKMESHGVRIDQSLCESEEAKGKIVMEKIATWLKLNPGSPKQLEQLLIEELNLPVVKRTPSGAASFDKFAMAEYEQMLGAINDPRATAVLIYRGWQKTVSSNYTPYLKLCSPDGRLRPNYKLHGTVTGRLSCEKPNLQQIPKQSKKEWNGSLKAAFVPADGYGLFEADYSQLELRLGAAYAKERILLEIFAEGRDIFTEMAAELGMSRFDTKTLTYTLQYGGGIQRISTVFGVDYERATGIKNNYFHKYPGFKTITDVAARKCRSQKFIRLWTGRRRHFDNPSEQAHKAFNAVIQGGSAEIVKRTMLRLDREIASPDCKMLLQVHDSVVFEIKDRMENYYGPLITKIMEDVQPDFGVRFQVDFHRWNEAA